MRGLLFTTEGAGTMGVTGRDVDQPEASRPAFGWPRESPRVPSRAVGAVPDVAVEGEITDDGGAVVLGDAMLGRPGTEVGVLNRELYSRVNVDRPRRRGRISPRWALRAAPSEAKMPQELIYLAMHPKIPLDPPSSTAHPTATEPQTPARVTSTTS
jgi:hypothetical protein